MDSNTEKPLSKMIQQGKKQTNDNDDDDNDDDESDDENNEMVEKTEKKSIEIIELMSKPKEETERRSGSRNNSNAVNTRKRNFGSIIKIADSFNQELQNDLTDRYYSENDQIPIILLNIELDRRNAKIQLFVKLIVYILFFIIYLIGLLNQRTGFEAYLLTTSIQRELIYQKALNKDKQLISFEDISTVQDFWDWIENVYVEKLFKSHWYSSINDTYSSNNSLWHTLGYQTKAIGGFRLNQTRSKPNIGSCYHSAFSHFVDNCYSETKSNDDMQCNDRIDCQYIKQQNATKYRSGGYYQDFPFGESYEARSDVINQLENLKKNRWIDEQTRSIQILTNFYNNNFKRWVSSSFTVHIDLAGKVEEDENMHILRIEIFNRDNINDIFDAILQIFFIIFVFGYFVFHCKLIYKHTKNNGFKGFIKNAKTHWFDWISVINNIIIIVIRSMYLMNKTRTDLLVKLGKDQQELLNYISLEELVEIDQLYIFFNVINLMILTTNGIPYFQVTDSGEAVYVALMEALPMILSYLPMYFMCISGFALAGKLLFGFNNQDFATFWDAMYVVVQINFGSYGYTQILWNNTNTLGKIYILTLFFVFIPFLINIFLAIIINAWDKYCDLRDTLAKVQQFGIRKIAFLQTVKAWWLRLPIKEIRNSMDLIQAEEIGYDEFVTILDSTQNITDKSKETILDYFWNDRDDKDKNQSNDEEDDDVQHNSAMLKQLFSKTANTSRKNLYAF